MLLLLDNYDSFTYNLLDYFLQLNVKVEVVRNDEYSIEELKKINPQGIVLSPGPGIPKNAGITMQVIEAFYQSIPMLGVCLGHQAIGEYFGANLEKAKVPMHGKTSIVNHTQKGLFKNIPQNIEVMRYHSLVIKNVQNNMEVIAKTDLPDGRQGMDEVMAIQHKTFPVYGVQFHPESILTKNGLSILDNWLYLSGLKS